RSAKRSDAQSWSGSGVIASPQEVPVEDRGELAIERLVRAREAGLDRAEGDLERLGDLLVGEVLDVAQHDDGAHLGREARDGRLDLGLELVARGGRERRLGALVAEVGAGGRPGVLVLDL